MVLSFSKRLLIYLVLVLLVIANWKQICNIYQGNEIKFFGFDHGSRRIKEHIPVFELERNCGVPYKCPKNTFPVFLSTASFTDNRPRLCVSGKYVIKPPRKSWRKGVNAASVDPDTFQVASVRHFNVSLRNHSEEMSKWIDDIPTADIIIVLISDDSSLSLSEKAKTLLNAIGSGRVQNLQYKSQWYMITQKGSAGNTVYEKITYSKKDDWGDAIEFHGCIPRKIPKKFLTVDDPLKQNEKKVEFCKGKTQEEYKGFCNEPRFETIRPALVTSRSMLKNVLYATPVFLFASSNLEVFLSSLDNMIHQPGVNPASITVLYDSTSNDVPDLAKIYGVHFNKSKFANTFVERLKQARRISRDLYPREKYLIVLDSGVIPSPDFLYFFSQLLPIFEKDLTVSAISGWSCNCYGHNGSLQTVYRVFSVPKYGALISAKSRENEFYEDILTPDVARLQGPEACHFPSLVGDTKIDRPQDLSKDLYYKKLVMIQQRGHVIKEEDVLDSCSNSIIKEDINVVYVESKSNLPKIMQCLGVLSNKYKEYNGIVRLSVDRKAVMVISSDSSFYKSRPIASEVASKGLKI